MMKKNCQYCDGEFLVKPSEFDRRHYCCKEHMNEARKKRISKKCDWKECEKVLDLVQSRVREKNFCSLEHRALYSSELLSNKIQKNCLWCGKQFDSIPAKAETANFCSQKHRALYYSTQRHGIEQMYPEKLSIEWSEGIGWLVGLVASDGNLSKYAKAITITSKDYDLLEQVQDIVLREVTGRKNAIIKTSTAWCYRFTSHVFYDFCSAVGLTVNKSLTIGHLNVPKEFFRHVLRGIIDGDGSLRVYTKKGCNFRHLQIRIVSGSKVFLEWTHSMCCEVFEVKGGGFCKVNKRQWTEDKQYWELVYSHYDSLRITHATYQDASYFLRRKYDVTKEFREK
jgi:hypothetical protein